MKTKFTLQKLKETEQTLLLIRLDFLSDRTVKDVTEQLPEFAALGYVFQFCVDPDVLSQIIQLIGDASCIECDYQRDLYMNEHLAAAEKQLKHNGYWKYSPPY